MYIIHNIIKEPKLLKLGRNTAKDTKGLTVIHVNTCKCN